MNRSLEDLRAAIYAGCAKCYIPYDTLENSTMEEVSLTSVQSSPEEKVIKNDLFRKLHTDSQWLIEIIYTSPDTFATPVTKQLTKRSLRLFLIKKKKWSNRRIGLAFREIHAFLSEVERR